MGFYFVQIIYGCGDTIYEVDDEIKYFKNEYEIKKFIRRTRKGRVVTRKCESLEQIFSENLYLIHDHEYIAYYADLRKEFGDLLDCFPTPSFTKEYIDKINLMAEEFLQELREDYASSYPTKQDLDDMYLHLKSDWEIL